MDGISSCNQSPRGSPTWPATRCGRLGRPPWCFQGRLLVEIGIRDIEQFLLGRVRMGAKPATRNRYANVLSVLLEREKAYGYIDENPARRVKKLREQE
jgi:hypothetical protein